jgi:hypothetical protein
VKDYLNHPLRHLLAALLLLPLLGGISAALADDCPANNQVLSIDKPIDIAGHNGAGLVDMNAKDTILVVLVPTANNATGKSTVTPDAAKIAEAIAKIKTGTPGVKITLAGQKDKTCYTPLAWGTAEQSAVANANKQPEGPGAGGQRMADSITPNSSECEAAAAKYYEQKKGERRAVKKTESFSLVVFCGKGKSFQYRGDIRRGGPWGHDVYAVVYDNHSPTVPIPSFSATSCSPQPDILSVYNSGSGTDFSKLAKAGLEASAPGSITQDDSFSCFDEKLDINLQDGLKSGTTPPPVVNTYSLPQSQTYLYTTQLGALWTDQVTHSYAISNDSSGTSRIRDTGTDGKGPSYFAAVVAYGLPHHLAALLPGHSSYHGRSLVHDNGFADRIGLLLGVGLKNPADEFLAGLTFEVIPGINITAANRWARIKQLNGVKVGDAFSGDISTLPQKTSWEHSTSMGVTMDLRFVTSLFTRE